MSRGWKHFTVISQNRLLSAVLCQGFKCGAGRKLDIIRALLWDMFRNSVTGLLVRYLSILQLQWSLQTMFQVTVTCFICFGFAVARSKRINRRVLIFGVLLLALELREYKITSCSHLSFDSRLFPALYVKGGKINDKFSHKGGGAVDILVFVSRHLSEGNFDIYTFAALLEREMSN
jgi:hypothetical protein